MCAFSQAVFVNQAVTATFVNQMHCRSMQLLEIISNAAVIQRQPVQLLVAIEKHAKVGIRSL